MKEFLGFEFERQWHEWLRRTFGHPSADTPGFGDVPPTGIPNITGYVMALISFIILSAASWEYILRRKFIRGSNG
jgi:hypothetical protein